MLKGKSHPCFYAVCFLTRKARASMCKVLKIPQDAKQPLNPPINYRYTWSPIVDLFRKLCIEVCGWVCGEVGSLSLSLLLLRRVTTSEQEESAAYLLIHITPRVPPSFCACTPEFFHIHHNAGIHLSLCILFLLPFYRITIYTALASEREQSSLAWL